MAYHLRSWITWKVLNSISCLYHPSNSLGHEVIGFVIKCLARDSTITFPITLIKWSMYLFRVESLLNQLFEVQFSITHHAFSSCLQFRPNWFNPKKACLCWLPWLYETGRILIDVAKGHYSLLQFYYIKKISNQRCWVVCQWTSLLVTVGCDIGS